MEKRIAALSTDPYVVDLVDRKASLFIDPKTGSILLDQGDGEDRMNGVVFSVTNGPTFTVSSTEAKEHRLLLSYCGCDYSIGDSANGEELVHWATSANSFLRSKSKYASNKISQNGAIGPSILDAAQRTGT